MLLSKLQVQRIAQYVRGYLHRTAVNYGHQNAARRATWRWMHTMNVLKNMRMILDGEQSSPERRQICEVAAIFHDIDHYTVELQYHGIKGAETAHKFLLREGYSEAFAAKVAEAVRGHHHDLDEDLPIAEQIAQIAAAQSKEASMVMDAETLDKIGAANIITSVVTLSGFNHPQPHEVARELTSSWPYQRAQSWYETLITPTGRMIGAQRLAFYKTFLQQLDAEFVMQDPYPQPSDTTQEMLRVHG